MTNTERICKYVQANPGKSAGEIAEALGQKDAIVSACLVQAVKKKYIGRKRAESYYFKNVGIWRYYA